MPISPRPLVVFGAMVACAWMPAAPVHATSPVETARAQERVVEPVAATDASQSMPESPLAVAAPLAIGDPELEIQLGSAEPAPRDASLFDLAFDVSLQGM